MSSRETTGVGSPQVSIDSRNLGTLDRWAVDVRRVEKPWGYELIWALTDRYCGKVLFVRCGHSLSLQFHREKDEAWLVQSGRARLEPPAGPRWVRTMPARRSSARMFSRKFCGIS